MLYSKIAQSSGGTGFFFDGDKNAPSDAFEVAQSDVTTATNLPAGATYQFTPPVVPSSVGVLVVTPAPPPTSAQLLSQAQTTQLALLASAYQAAILKNVSYTSKAGVAKTYQADTASVSNLQSSLLGCQSAQAAPPGFFWVASDNTQVPFTFADLQGLAAVIFAQGAVAFAHLQTLKTAVNAATTVAAVQAITF